MPVIKKNTSVKCPLIIEPHPVDYNGYPFVTLISYRKQHMLTIVDNYDGQTIDAYVLDLCVAEDVNEEMLIQTASEWYDSDNHNYPISIEFSKRGMTNEMSRIYRSLNVDFISRFIGPVFRYPMNRIKSVKRRRRKTIPSNIEVISK